MEEKQRQSSSHKMSFQIRRSIEKNSNARQYHNYHSIREKYPPFLFEGETLFVEGRIFEKIFNYDGYLNEKM